SFSSRSTAFPTAPTATPATTSTWPAPASSRSSKTATATPTPIYHGSPRPPSLRLPSTTSGPNNVVYGGSPCRASGENVPLVVEMRGGSSPTFSRLLVPVSSRSLRIYGHGGLGVMRCPDTGGSGIGVGHVIRRRRTAPRTAAGRVSQ